MPSCKITVLKRELYADLQKQYSDASHSGKCPYFKEGQEFLVQSSDLFGVFNSGFCPKAWECLSRHIYLALQGASMAGGSAEDENLIITCCNDGTRPVIFKLERIDD